MVAVMLWLGGSDNYLLYNLLLLYLVLFNVLCHTVCVILTLQDF